MITIKLMAESRLNLFFVVYYVVTEILCNSNYCSLEIKLPVMFICAAKLSGTVDGAFEFTGLYVFFS